MGRGRGCEEEKLEREREMVVTHSAVEHDGLVEALLADGARITALNQLLFGGRGPICLHNKKMLPIATCMTYLIEDILQVYQRMY